MVSFCKSNSQVDHYDLGDSQNAAQLKQELEVARSELESKISENESVHIQLFELKQSTAEQIRVLREKINELENKLKKK